ncbi:hypothetical protein HY487_01465 [Candidatus Woesearchaeota archaeon]|nr:hypothetical protein [Candidatus Woesearchaeota archaeon]
MPKKFLISLFLALVINISAFYAEHEVPGGPATTSSSSTFSTENVDLQNNVIKPNSEVPQGQNGKTFTMKGSGPVKYGEDIFNLDDGQQLQILEDGSAQVKKAAKIQVKDKATGEETVADNVENGKVNSDGSFELGSVKNLKKGPTTIINGKGVKFKNGVLTAEHADSFIKDNSVTTNVNNLDSEADFFSVDSADSFLSDCLRVDDIEDSEFKVGDKVEVTTKSDVGLKITDCSYNEAEFRGKGKVAVDKGDNPTYTIENGTLTKKENEYNETVEANNSAVIETDKTFGFRCITINPVGSYFYSDKDLRKDFVINVPKESKVYRLCLRKSQSQQFKEYNGLVDFANKKIELNGIVNYLRYHLKNNQVASLLSDFAYKGLKNVRNLMSYDKDLLFLSNVAISDTLENKEQISITRPNNYYNIKEMEIDGKVHRVIGLNNVDKSQLTQDLSYNYESDSLSSKISISGNVMVQGNAGHAITILPPGHEKIDEALRWPFPSYKE